MQIHETGVEIISIIQFVKKWTQVQLLSNKETQMRTGKFLACSSHSLLPKICLAGTGDSGDGCHRNQESVCFPWYHLMAHTDFALCRRGRDCCPGALQYIGFPFFFWFNFLISKERLAYINSFYCNINKFIVVLTEVQISKRRVCICLYFSRKMKNLRFQRPQSFCSIIVIATNDLEALYATSIAICSIALATNLFLLMAGMNQSL